MTLQTKRYRDKPTVTFRAVLWHHTFDLADLARLVKTSECCQMGDGELRVLAQDGKTWNTLSSGMYLAIFDTGGAVVYSAEFMDTHFEEVKT